MLQCKAVGHDWEDIEATRAPEFGFYLQLRCTGCGTKRYDIVNRWGELLSRSYQYPEGYKEIEKYTKAQWRMMMLKGLTKGQRAVKGKLTG